MADKKKVGLALSGGGAKGLAHIGVLKILEKHKIPIDYIAGTSIGALVGALYCAEPNAKKLEKETLKIEWKKLFDYTIPTKGLIKGKKIEEFLKEKFGDLKFNELKIPLYITSFDIDNKQEVIFHRGNVAKAVRASMSIPGIFVPTENNGKILVDGGLTDLIPTEILKKEGANIIIAVNLNSIKGKKPNLKEEAFSGRGKKKVPGIAYTLSRSLQIIESEASKAELNSDKADVVIDLELEDVATLDFSRMKEIIKRGERKAREHINEIKELTNPHLIKELIENIKNIPILEQVKKSADELVGKEIKNSEEKT